MTCQVHVGILDENGKLTKEAKENFISEVLLILEYGTENIPAEKKPPIPYSDKISPDPSYIKYRKNDKTYLRDEKIYSAFYKNWLGRYEKLAKDLNLKPNFSLLPAIADPIAIAGSGFNAEIPTPDFPGGFTPYFTGLLPQKLIGELVDAGEEKFLSPTGPLDLVKTLIEKKSPPVPPPPTPPIIIPPPPPPGFSLPQPDPNIKINLNLTPEQLAANAPKPPEAVLSDLSAKESAAFENLPKALGEIISKIPSFLSKIANPPEVVSEIAKTIKKAGVLGPEPKETSTLEKAAQAVLTSKIAEMTFVGALSVTIGSAPGSATTAITQQTSSSQPEFKYKPAPRKKPSKNKELTPAQKAYQKAIGLSGTSYGDISKRDRYLRGLFYMESAYESYPKEYLNAYGEFPEASTEEIKPIDAELWQKIKNTKNDGLDLARAPGKDRVAVTPVDDPTGFFRFAEYEAGKLSSCAMFVRCCYQAAGAINYFFLSLYASSTGFQLIENIGLMRNFRWVSEDPDYNFSNPKDGKRAIINDLYELEPPDARGARNPKERNSETLIPGITFKDKILTVGELKKNLEEFAGKDSKYNRKYNAAPEAQKKKDILGKINVDFGGDWSLEVETNGTVKTNEKLLFLTSYLKPRDERAFFYNKEIGYMTINPDSFPALEKGDALLIVKTESATAGNDWVEAGEHILLIGNDRPAGYKIVKSGNDTKLVPELQGIEGGSLDDDNLKESPEKVTTWDVKKGDEKAITKTVEALLKAAVAPPGPIGDAKNYDILKSGITAPDAAGAISFFKNGSGAPGALASAVEKGKLTLKGKSNIPSPSAILPATHDLGLVKTSSGKYVPDNQLGPGLFLGATNVARTKQFKNAGSINSGQSIKTHPEERRIIGIFKTNNYCNKHENNGPLANIAAAYMDLTIVNDTSRLHRQQSTLDFRASNVFPGKIPQKKSKTSTENPVAGEPENKSAPKPSE